MGAVVGILDQINPWLIIAAVAVVSFALGRFSVRGEALRVRDAERQVERAHFNSLEQPVRDEISSLVASGQKIEAIKRYRELTDSGLRESKELIDSLAGR